MTDWPDPISPSPSTSAAERLARLEVIQHHLTGRVNDHGQQLTLIQQRMERVGGLVTSASTIVSRHEAVLSRFEDMERDRAAKKRESERRKAVRKEVLGAAQWMGAVLLFAAAALNLIEADKAKGLLGLLK